MSEASAPSLEQVRALPKVALHDHLDGGLRPATVVELAERIGHRLPTTDPEDLGRWFVAAASSGSLERYLETFEHTVAVMQTADGLARVAREAVLDLAEDGVVLAELRYAPEQHLAGGLAPQEVVDAVQAGLAEGVAEAAAAGRAIAVGQVVTALRHRDAGDWTAELALANRDRGVVGFDVAGPESGHPALRHASALQTLREASFPVTVHAGEGAGLESIAEAVHRTGALRVGHGVRIVDDVELPDGVPVDDLDAADVRLGRLARWVLDQQVPLEMCPTSNVQTGAAPSIAAHPVTALLRLGFAVTVNTDNRLMSGTSATEELYRLVTEAGWTPADLRDVTITAAWSAFRPLEERAALVDDVIIPAYTEPANGRHRA
ncbi:MAG: adenosine deaminase [Actinomycetales bacterium]|nr:adenosine deaminase [Actinomycetales bacterium]